jgi:hypothetical protein
MKRHRFPLPLSLAVCLASAWLSPVAWSQASKLADYTNAKLSDLGIELVPAKKDAQTGFVVGGKNSTSLIQSLTELNGRTIAELEADMRPGQASGAGFLGKDERLLDVLAADNKFVVEEKKLTHQELAKHLLVVGAVGIRHFSEAVKEGGSPEKAFRYHGREFKVSAALARGHQHSPFEDGTKSNADITVLNVAGGKKLQYSLLVPYMIERYGFYEGKGTKYRVDPRDVLAVLDFLAADDKAGR